MPHYIAKGCMNWNNKCPKGVSFHSLPRKNPSLLHQASFCRASRLAYVNIKCWDNIDRSFQWLLVLHLTDVSINDANARVCGEHFIREPGLHPACYQWICVISGFVLSVDLGLQSQHWSEMLYPSVFCYTFVPKRRRTSELRVIYCRKTSVRGWVQQEE